MYPHETEYFENIFNKNITLIKICLSERITKIENTELETSRFDYIDLCNQYKGLEQRINDTIDYLIDKPKRRQLYFVLIKYLIPIEILTGILKYPIGAFFI